MNNIDFYRKANLSVGIAKIIFDHLLKKYPVKKVNEFAKTSSGSTPNRSIPEYFNGNIPWLKSGELNDNIIYDISETITEEGLKNSSAKLLPKATLVVAMYGATAGKCGILGKETTTNQAVCAIFPNENEVLSKYLFWFFRQERLNYLQISKGGAQPNISQTVIKKTKVPIPPLDIQRKIIDYLYEIQNNNLKLPNFFVNGLKNKLQKYFSIYNFDKESNKIFIKQQTYIQKLRQQILQEAIQGKLTEEWRRQNPNVEPASELLKRIKAEKERLVKEGKIKKGKPLPPIKEDEKPFELPKGWVWCRLGEVNYIMMGQSPKGSSYNTEGKGIPLVNGPVEFGGNNPFDKTIIKKFTTEPTKVCKEGDLLVCVRGSTTGRTNIAGYNSCIGRGVAAIRPLFEFYRFIHYFIIHARDNIFGLGRGSTFPNISQDKLKYIPIGLPTVSEQKIISEKLDKIMNDSDNLESNTERNRQYADKLMQVVLREAFES